MTSNWVVAPKRDFDPMGQGQAPDGIPSPFTVTGQVKLSFLLFTLTSLPLRATHKSTAKPAYPFQPLTGLSSHQTYSALEKCSKG